MRFPNVPAHRIPHAFLEALEVFVVGQAGGLAMIGGKYSFGSGGFFESPIDPLLPVSMELRENHRTLSVAMAIVMDRSGSMAMSVASGETKMDLANEGAARSIELLGPHDAVTVFAVDSEAHRIVPLVSLSSGRRSALEKVRRVESMGGGIYVYEGLHAAWQELQRVPHGKRHIILFSDAADSEQPGGYERLVATMVENQTRVSVIGPVAAPPGTELDLDEARLAELREAARLSGGVERRELTSVWDEASVRGALDLRPYLLTAFLVVFLIEAIVSRVGWQLPAFELPALRKVSPRHAPGPVRVEVTEPEPVTSEAPKRDGMKRRFARAKSGR